MPPSASIGSTSPELNCADAPDDGRWLAIFTEAVDRGGAERVVQTLADRFAAAPIVANRFEELIDSEGCFPPWTIQAHLAPSGRRKHHFLGPLYARRLAAAPVDGARVVLALACGGWALAAPVPRGARFVCYCTGLPPALYGESRLYLESEAAALRPLLRAAVPPLRAYYRHLMRRPHRLLAVSRYAADAIAHVYGREAEVIHPPVRTGFFTPAPAPKRHYLAVARLVPQKQLGVVIEAFRGLDAALSIVGHGPWIERLRATAPVNVHFTGWVDDATLRELYRASWGLVCPSVEDFGIVMAEAQACGIPVIAPRAGGALEIVSHSVTGILLDDLDPGSVAAAVRRVTNGAFEPERCRASAERFAEERFVGAIGRILARELAAADGHSKGARCTPPG